MNRIKIDAAWLPFLILVLLTFSSACSSQTPSPAETSPLTPLPGATSPLSTAQGPRLEGTATVVLQVKGQPITIEVNGTDAPITAGNFVDLVNRGAYNGTTFHRVERDPQPFVVQGGDPLSKDPKNPPEMLGTGSFIDPQTGQPRYIPLEILPEGANQPAYSQPLAAGTALKLSHRRGAVAMARSQLPDSASSQFYITLSDLPDLDGQYAVFGYVTQGMDVVDRIQKGDRIESAKVTQGLENLKP